MTAVSFVDGIGWVDTAREKEHNKAMNTYKVITNTGTALEFNAKRDWSGAYAVLYTEDGVERIYSRHANLKAAGKGAASIAKVEHFSNVHIREIVKA